MDQALGQGDPIEKEVEEVPLQPNQVCTALQDFDGEQEGDLSFTTGEMITIIEPCELMYWYKAKNMRGDIGIVPSPFLELTQELHSPPLPPKDISQPKTSSLPRKADVPGLPPKDNSLPRKADVPGLPPKDKVLSPKRTHPPITDDKPPPPLMPKPVTPSHSVPSAKEELESSSDYIKMESAAVPHGLMGAHDKGYFHVSPSTFQKHSSDPLDQKAFIAQEKEKKRRLKPGTPIMGICQFVGQQPGDLSFNVYEEMIIINPLPDLCWYTAQKTDHPDQKGIIPVTHVTLVYMSDDEADQIPDSSASNIVHDMLYDDMNDFLGQSGWFSYPGLTHGQKALHHVLAKKCGLEYDNYLNVKSSVYRLTYHLDEKVFVGKAKVLHKELGKHFMCFGKKREKIREIDDELCHHTEMSGWDLKVWVLEAGEDLDCECAKRIIESNALVSKDNGGGITEEMSFETMSAFDDFWKWFMPGS